MKVGVQIRRNNCHNMCPGSLICFVIRSNSMLFRIHEIIQHYIEEFFVCTVSICSLLHHNFGFFSMQQHSSHLLSRLCNKITEKDLVVLFILLATRQNALDLKPSAESLIV